MYVRYNRGLLRAFDKPCERVELFITQFYWRFAFIEEFTAIVSLLSVKKMLFLA